MAATCPPPLCTQPGCILELKDGSIFQEKLEIVFRNTMMKQKTNPMHKPSD